MSASPPISRAAFLVTAVAVVSLVHAVTAPATAPPIGEAVSSKPSAAKKRSATKLLPVAQKRLHADTRERGLDPELDELEEKYVWDNFRRGRKGQLQALRGSGWQNICSHNKLKHSRFGCVPCKKQAKIMAGETIVEEQPNLDPDILQLQKDFPHMTFRISRITGKVQCMMGKCWLDVCGHGVHPSRCRPCDGSALCTEHDVYRCSQCMRSLYCDCNILRVNCAKHDGSNICSLTGRQKSKCACCRGVSVCPRCNDRTIQDNGTCRRCSDNFVETPTQCSKAACKFIDQVEEKLGLELEHRHLDVNLGIWGGGEHKIPGWRRKHVDGYNKAERIVVEFLGDDVHGYPPLWEDNFEKVDRIGRYMQDNYHDTYEKLHRLKELGYIVLYAWQSDTDLKSGESKLPGVFREFTGELEWN